MQIKASWADVKSLVDSKGCSIQHVTVSDRYIIVAIDSNFSVYCNINKDDVAQAGSDQEDFENNYLSTSNKILHEVDSEGATVAKTKMASDNAKIEYRSVEFITGTLGSIHNKDQTDTDIGDVYLHFYDASNVEQLTQTDIDNNAVWSVLDIAPSYPIWVVSGELTPRPDVTISQNMWAWFIMAPDTPFECLCAEGGYNLRFKPTFFVDGRTPILLPVGINKLRFKIKHAIGVKIDLMLLAIWYRE
jgi:hypothetical protein